MFRLGVLPLMLLLLPVTAWAGDRLSPGGAALSMPPSALTSSLPGESEGKGLKLGSVGMGLEDGRPLDVLVSPNARGGVAAGISSGAAVGQPGTGYGMQFSLNPSWANMSENGDMAMTVTVHHALTPNFNLVGSAEARRPTDRQDGGEFTLGAGLGLRF